MNIISTPIPEVLILEPQLFEDERGFFFERFNERRFAEQTGVTAHFIQDNYSRSLQHVVRGLHYQIQQPQGKLVGVTVGEIWDVAVDLRQSSATFGQWVGVELSTQNRLQLWIPPGFAHGFAVRSPIADVIYKLTDYHAPEHERCLLWNDPLVAIDWQLAEPILSAKDQAGQPLQQCDVFA